MKNSRIFLLKFLPFLTGVKVHLFLWILLVSILPPLILLGISYYQTLNQAKRDLANAVEQANQRMDHLLKSADITLHNLAADLQSIEQDDEIQRLRLLQRVVYQDHRFREVGVIDRDGFLVLTSLGKLTPPAPIPSDLRADLTQKRLQIVGTVFTLIMQEKSIVLALPTDALGEVNILVDPEILTTYWEEVNQLDLGQQGFLAYVNAADGMILASTGSIPINLATQLTPSQPNHIRILKTSGDENVIVIGEVSKAWVLRNWYRSLYVGLPLTILGSGLIMLLFIKLGYISQALDSELRNALAKNEFEVHYQPILDIQTGACVGAEALIRWQHPQQGLLLPGVFILTAETTGFICELGNWVLDQVIDDKAILNQIQPDLYISINLSPLQINGSGIEHIFLMLVEHSKELSGRMMFEVTEAILVDDIKTAALDTIARLHNLGAAIALDDFGTGYSNLGYLHKFQIDYIKIDRLFVSAIHRGSRISSVVDSIIDLGRNLEMELIAEGIETEEQFLFLRQRGIRYAQGRLLASPMPLKAFQNFVSQNLQAPFSLDSLDDPA